MKKIMLFVLISLVHIFSYAQSVEIQNLFAKHYYENYESGKCGPNIYAFIEAAHVMNLDLTTAQALVITNVGFNNFGLVDANHARNYGRLISEDAQARHPGEANWYHHVVLEHDGLIFDFDFGSFPRITSLQNYFGKMFLDDESDNFKNEKLKKYQIEIIPAMTWITSKQNKVRTPEGEKLRFETYLLGK